MSRICPILDTCQHSQYLRATTEDYEPENHDGVITHLQPDILECEVKWALTSLCKASGRWWNSSWAISNPERWCCESAICQPICKTQQWPQDWKRSGFIPIPKKGNGKECSNYCTIALISHISKVMLKILQARLQQYMNCELPDVQVGFRKGRGTRDQLANTRWIIEKAREFQKTSTSALLTKPTPLTVWITETVENSEGDGNTRPP